VSLALKEWHVACEAIARGDQVLTLRKGGIREKAFAVRESAFWLFPTWEHQNAEETKRAWRGELTRSQRERRADGRIPLRCRCTVVDAWELDDPERLAGLDELHLWTRAYMERRLGWRPRKPLTVLLLRAAALLDSVLLEPSADYGGCRSWIDLGAEPPTEGLIPSLTDDAFALRERAVRAALGDPARLALAEEAG
jgi:hypothetical protein